MSDGRCSCFIGKVLQKVLSVDDKNMDGTRLMNHSILCAQKWGGKLCTTVEKNHHTGEKLAPENDAWTKIDFEMDVHECRSGKYESLERHMRN